MDISVDKKIVIKSTLVSGGPISIHQWKIDDILQTDSTDTLTIPPNTLSHGLHNIYYKGTNYCGSFTELNQQINIMEVISTTYTQTDPVLVSTPTVVLNVKLRRTGTVNVTVIDESDVPVPSATVSIAGVSGITDATGNVSLTSVPYGSQTATTTIM